MEKTQSLIMRKSGVRLNLYLNHTSECKEDFSMDAYNL